MHGASWTLPSPGSFMGLMFLNTQPLSTSIEYHVTG